MTTSITLDGVTFTDTGFAARGHLTPTTVNGASYPQWQALFVAGLRQISANIATTGAVLTDTSASSVSIGSGTKTFTVSSGKGFSTGMWVVVADAALPTTNYMAGTVTSYSGTTLVISVPANGYAGSGTITSWTIGVSGQPGLQGAAGVGATYWGGVNSGTANALTLTTTSALSSATRGLKIDFRTGAGANTGAVTVAVDSIGSKTVQKNGAACIAGDLAANTNYSVMYDGTYFQLVGGSGSGGSGSVSLTRLSLYS